MSATIDELQTRWQEACEQGDHAAAYSIEQEIDALGRQAKREAVQHEADKAAKKRQEAVEGAAATLRAIENHKGVRADFETLVCELEQATHAVDAALARVKSEWPRLVHSYPRWEQYREPEIQDAYNDALGSNKYPAFPPLQLRLRLPKVLDVLRERGSRGLTDLLNAADARF